MISFQRGRCTSRCIPSARENKIETGQPPQTFSSAVCSAHIRTNRDASVSFILPPFCPPFFFDRLAIIPKGETATFVARLLQSEKVNLELIICRLHPAHQSGFINSGRARGGAVGGGQHRNLVYRWPRWPCVCDVITRIWTTPSGRKCTEATGSR